MSDISGKKLRFSDVAFAIDTTPKSLRNWLQRNQVRLTKRDEGGWREFSFTDVAILALVRQMVDFGLTVEEASSIANAVVIGYGIRFDQDAPTYEAALRFSDDWLFLWRQRGEWKMQVGSHAKSTEPREKAYISIQLSPVVGVAFERAIMGTELDEYPDDADSFAAAAEKLIISIKDATPSKDDE